MNILMYKKQIGLFKVEEKQLNRTNTVLLLWIFFKISLHFYTMTYKMNKYLTEVLDWRCKLYESVIKDVTKI